ncbi:MAG: hypothetical protein ACKVQK_17320 [Burkholderiales bacterium]
MSTVPERRIVFNEEAIVAYGGSGAGIHSEIEAANAAGFPALVSWGTATMLPFWEILEQIAGEHWLIGGSVAVRLKKPVCAGDEVHYFGQQVAAADSRRTIELVAETARHGVVATVLANLPRIDVPQP